jgi:hypothetical protein
MATDHVYNAWIASYNAWANFNSGKPANQQIGPPVDPPPADLSTYVTLPGPFDALKSPNCTFVNSLDATGQTLPPNTHWFGDALLMKAQGGGTPYLNLKWDTTTNPTGPRWSFKKSNSVSPKIVYEFCTCVAANSSSCVRKLTCGFAYDGVTPPCPIP